MTGGTDIEMGFDIALFADDPLRRIATMGAKALARFKWLITIPALAVQQPMTAGLAQVCGSDTMRTAIGTALSLLGRLPGALYITGMLI